MKYREYTAKILNISKNEDISDMVSECSIALPSSSLISTLEAKFILDECLIDENNKISIQILNENKEEIYSLQGKARVNKRSKSYTYKESWEYSVKDSYDKLFEKVVPENLTYYDLYFCNNSDTNNSLFHIIASNLGFKNKINATNIIYENGEFIRLPFIYLEKDSRWVDILQSFIDATHSNIFVFSEQLFLTTRNFGINQLVEFNRTNIINNIEEVRKEVLQNGIKQSYDRFEILDNQVVFNVQNKIIVDENTNKDTEVPIMKINYITSAVSEPTITNASGYYFTSDSPDTLTRINLVEGTHYVLESFKETGCEVKFYNPMRHKLYIDMFEIKGKPISKFEDNEASVTFQNIEKNQENFLNRNKNIFIQTQKQATFLAKNAMRREIINSYEYNFSAYFMTGLVIGQNYKLKLDDIDTVVQIESININLKTSDFRMSIKAKEIKYELGKVKVNAKLSGNSNNKYIDLSNVEKSIEENKEELKTVKADINSKLHRMTTTPTENVVENDVWFNPETNIWKKFYNGKWNSISEAEILPAMKLYNSVETNVIKFQNTADKVGAYLLNDGEKFGSLNGELASVTFDKMGQFEAKNINNLIALNIKDPANPQRITSKILLGVTDVNSSRWNDTIFAVGDESSPTRLEFKNNKLVQYVNGKDLSQKINEVDKNINNLSKGVSDSLNTAKSYTDTKKTEIDRNINNLSKGISDSLNTAKGYADTKKTEAINTSKSYADTKKNEAIASSKSYADTKIIEEKERNSLLALMSTGKMLYTDPEFKSGINDIKIYNNAKPNNVITHTRALKQKTDALYPPNTSGYVIEIKNAGTINNTTVHPGAGGFYFATASRKEAIFITRIVARLPVGWKINFASNSTGASRVEKWLTSQNGTGKYEEYIFYLKCGNSTNTNDYSSTNFFYLSHTTNHYQAMTWYLAYATVYDCVANKDEKLYEIDRRLTNADGKLTQLQQNYQDTVRDVTNFKTRTASEIDTVQGALRNGNFVITGNTSFDGSARFVSRGTNEVITIANGSIDFHRDGKKLTRIKNSRYGTIATDSKGTGIVTFDGFKQPMILLTSIKSANFGKNMASIFCYAEHIKDCMYRIFVGGTNEHYVEAKPIKVVGTEWRADNAMEATITKIEGKFDSQTIDVRETDSVQEARSDRDERYKRIANKSDRNIKIPTFNVKIVRVENNSEVILANNNYTISYNSKPRHRNFTGGVRFVINGISLTKEMNILKKFTNRTNVKFKIVITITQPYLEVEKVFLDSDTSGGHDSKTTTYDAMYYKGTPFTLTLAHFGGLTITASASTSTLSDVTGSGEVQYIAMEID